MADDLGIPVLGEIPLIQSIREAGDVGRPAALQEGSKIAEIYTETARKMVESLVERNKFLPPTEAVKITTMAGCSPVLRACCSAGRPNASKPMGCMTL